MGVRGVLRNKIILHENKEKCSGPNRLINIHVSADNYILRTDGSCSLRSTSTQTLNLLAVLRRFEGHKTSSDIKNYS